MAFERTTISRGQKYRQLVENRWDPELKQSRTHVIKHLGKVIEKDGKEILKPSPLKIDDVVKAYPVGKLAIFWKLIQNLNIQKAVSKQFGEDGKKISNGIIILVLNQLTERKPLTKLDTWINEGPFERWMSIKDTKLTKDYFLNALDSISGDYDDIHFSHANSIQNNLTKGWRKVVGKEPKRYLFFHDITRILWNGGKKNTYAENGHGKLNGRLHMGFGLVVSKDNYMPILGYPVRGSNHDTTTVKETINNLKGSDMKNITLVWDRGFVSKKNVDMAMKSDLHVLSAGVKSNSDVIDLISRYNDHEIEQRNNIMRMSKDKGIYVKDDIEELFGQECKVVVAIDPQKKDHARVSRDLLLHTLETETDKKKVANLKKGLKPLVTPSRGRRGYTIDIVEEDIARRCDGRSLFFCTDKRMSAEEIVRTYFQKDIVEKAFRHLKGNACLSPLRYQLPGRIESYLSVVNFIAYEIIAGVLWKLRQNDTTISYDELMTEADKIYEVQMTSKGKNVYRWTHMTKPVENLFKPYSITNLQA